jgi:hypothetical protein
MPTVITGYAVKAVMGVGIRWEYRTLHLFVLSDNGRLAPTLLRRLLDLPQNPKIYTSFAFIFAA